MSAGVGPGPQGKDAVVNTEYGADEQRQGHESDHPVTPEEVIALDKAQMPSTDSQSKGTAKNG